MFAHLAIFGLVIYGVIAVMDEERQNKESILVSLAVGVIVLLLFAGPWGVLTAGASAAVAYALSRNYYSNDETVSNQDAGCAQDDDSCKTIASNHHGDAKFYVGGETINPHMFVLFSIKTAQEMARHAVESIVGHAKNEVDIAVNVKLRTIPAYLQYTALGIAVYWFYAVRILHANKETQEEMAAALHEGMDLIEMDGQKIQNGFMPNLVSDINDYVMALIGDYENPPEEGIFNPDVCMTSKVHREKMEKYYSPMSEIDKYLLVNISADISTNLQMLIFERLKVKLTQNS